MREENILNLTPHDIVIVGDDGGEIERFPPSGLARLSTETVRVEGTFFSRTVFGEVQGLPEAQAGTYLIVSQLVKSALPGRADLVVPAEVARDGQGRIIGCRSLGL